MLMRALVLLSTFVLHLTPSRGTGASWSDRTCDIEPGFQSPYIFPHYERYAIGKGCWSRETTTTDSQVHIINLRRGPPRTLAPSDGKNNRVVLKIQPYIRTDWQRGQLIFVLNSQRPTEWEIQTEHIDNSSRHLFMICRECRLVKDDGIRIKIKKLDLPHSAAELSSWGRQQYGNITSLSELDQANTVTLKLNPGEDVDVAAVCEIKENFYTPASTAVFLVPQQLSGCAIPSNEGLLYRDVHIIELHKGSSDTLNPNRVQQVVLDIQTRVKTRGTHYLLLILKAHTRVKWKLRTHGIRGQMEIMTDEKVDTEEALVQSVRVAIEERLGNYAGSSLIRWAQEQCGPLASYSDIQLANRIYFYIDGADGLKVEMPSPGNFDDDALNLNQGRGGSNPFESLSKTREALDNVKLVQCLDQGMTVALRKSQVRPYGVRKGHLSLMETSCVASSNATHFILTTSLSECNTQQIKYPDKVVFKNAIMLHPLDGDIPVAPSSTKGAEDEGSGIMTDETYIDDEDFQEQIEPIKVTFMCEYLTTGQPSPPIITSSRSSTDQYKLHVYSDSTYQNRSTHFPKRITVGQSLYIEAKVEAEASDLDVLVHSCWVTSGVEKHILIEHGCVVDRSIRWQQSYFNAALIRGSHRQRFSFTYNAYFDDAYMNHVVCELRLCSKDVESSSPQMQKCVSREQYCKTQHARGGDQGEASIIPVTVGPFLVILPDPSSPFKNRDVSSTSTLSPNSVPKDPAAVSADDDQPPCQQVVHVEGLDSGTVVGIAFAAFVIGILLTAALWFIHTHTGPIRRQNPPRSTETSGESTPSSTAPITIHQIHT